jgi:hypothetical protein
MNMKLDKTKWGFQPQKNHNEYCFGGVLELCICVCCDGILVEFQFGSCNCLKTDFVFAK